VATTVPCGFIQELVLPLEFSDQSLGFA